MTTPSQSPVNDVDCIQLEKIRDHVSDGNTPVTGFPPRKTMGKLVSEVPRLSTISEQELDKPDIDPSSYDPLGGSEWGGSTFSMCSDKFKNSSSRFSSDDSYQPDTGDDCAGLLLACLHCRFYELMVLLPDTCERAVSRCFPSFKYITASSEMDQQGKDGLSSKLDVDCNCCSSCRDISDLLELAMEVSEMCYR
ncbi:myoD family inhibitor domain-containing protein 2-like [Thunnus albacares]|uniref:myoD family inhibitor domain-containing protein 2-like n=1 Tax=Thunnus albacares TaxID=8236 RepID=UPI001CF6C7E1|nr:myoD family inhibitor domain-containing protein 2-like [Thunnus albacares]